MGGIKANSLSRGYFEAKGLHKVQRYSGGCAGASDGASVLGDLGLHQDHMQVLSKRQIPVSSHDSFPK